MKLLENTIGENLDDPGFGDGFLDMTAKAWHTWKKKLLSWTSLKLKLSALGKSLQENEKTTHRQKVPICKRHIW